MSLPPPSERRWRDDLFLAHTIADQVDRLTASHFDAQDFEVESKPDLSPVTTADREAERMIREHLSRARTRDAIYGEEYGGPPSSPWWRTARWSSAPSPPRPWGGGGGA